MHIKKERHRQEICSGPGSSTEWKFYKQIFELIISEAQGILNCGGDFNVKLCPILDTSNPYYRGDKKIIKNLKLMLVDLGLSDIWRDLNPTKTTFFSHPTFCLF